MFINIINIDKKYLYHNLHCNRKNVTFFNYNNKAFLINNTNFKSHFSFQSWTYFNSRIFGLNNNIIKYFLSFIGCHTNIFFTDLEEYSFSLFRSLLKYYNDYFSLSWYLLLLYERSILLPFTYRGSRYLKKLPSRGQRTRSNYENSKKRRDLPYYEHFKKRLTSSYKDAHFPSWRRMEYFYFHRF